jgi:mevalonate kinase
MFPNMLTPAVTRLINKYRSRALGWKLSGAGGGGYLILVASQPIKKALRVTVRRDA